MSGSIACAGTVTTGATGAAQCVDGGGVPLAWTVVADFDFTQLDSTALGGCFVVGFSIVGTCWVIGKGIGTVLRFIKGI